MIRWYARGGGIANAGPFDTQIKATESIRRIIETDAEYARFVAMHGRIRPQMRWEFPPDAFVWPEEA